jgi:hypothetical protein
VSGEASYWSVPLRGISADNASRKSFRIAGIIASAQNWVLILRSSASLPKNSATSFHTFAHLPLTLSVSTMAPFTLAIMVSYEVFILLSPLVKSRKPSESGRTSFVHVLHSTVFALNVKFLLSDLVRLADPTIPRPPRLALGLRQLCYAL